MSRTSRWSSFVVIGGIVAALVALGTPRVARAGGEPLPTDPALVRGTLENGNLSGTSCGGTGTRRAARSCGCTCIRVR